MSLLGRLLGSDTKATLRGLALLEEGRFSEAAEQLRLIAIGSGGEPADSLASYHFRQALVGEGRRLLRDGDSARAVPWLAEAAGLWPRYADLQFLHGAAMLLAGGGAGDEVLNAARRSLRLNPDYIEARLLEAEMLRRRERPREAAESLNALVESGRRVDHWLVAELTAGAPYALENVPADLVSRLQRVVGGSSPKEEVAAAVALCRAGHWEDGLSRFESLVDRHPRYPDYRTRQAAALFHLGRSDEALDAVDAALALNESYLLAQDLRGLVLIDLLRLREARDHFRGVDHLRAEGVLPGEAAAVPAHERLFGVYVRAMVTMLTGDAAGALTLLPSGPELGRDFARAELLRAAAEDLAGQPAACARRLARLVESWPAEPLYHHLLICRLLGAGQLKEAVQQLGRWPAGAAADARPLYLENLLRLEQGREPVSPTMAGSVGTVVAAAAAVPEGEPRVDPEAWRLLGARVALRRGDAPAAWSACADLQAEGWLTEPLVSLQTAAALALGGGPAATWEPPTVAPLAGLAARVAWLHVQGRGQEAEQLAAGIGRLHPEVAAGWWLSVRFWLTPVRAWIS
jgi:tetratricopeptide (TPR) repeat protein